MTCDDTEFIMVIYLCLFRILVSGTLGDRSPPALHLFRNFDPPATSSAWIAANQIPFKTVEKPAGKSSFGRYNDFQIRCISGVS